MQEKRKKCLKYLHGSKISSTFAAGFEMNVNNILWTTKTMN